MAAMRQLELFAIFASSLGFLLQALQCETSASPANERHPKTSARQVIPEAAAIAAPPSARRLGRMYMGLPIVCGAAVPATAGISFSAVAAPLAPPTACGRSLRANLRPADSVEVFGGAAGAAGCIRFIATTIRGVAVQSHRRGLGAFHA
jgi:hypothetical protein